MIEGGPNQVVKTISAGKGEFALLSRKCKPCFSQQGHDHSNGVRIDQRRIRHIPIW